MRSLALLLLAACGPSADSAVSLAPCEGGGQQLVEMGKQGPSGFTPWVDGDPVELSELGGAWSLSAGAAVAGMDTTEQVTAVLRVKWTGSDTDDYLGAFFLQCEEASGESPLTVTAELPADLQADPSPLDGVEVPVTLTVTDHEGRSATQTLDLVLVLP